MQRELLWGIRTSFLRYLGHSGPHRISGERRPADGPFIFNGSSSEADRWSFTGVIDIVAHGGLLRLTLADPVLELHDLGEGSLTFQVGPDGTPVELLRLSQVSPLRWHAELTDAGASVFDDVYPPGVAMADVIVLEAASSR